MEAKNLSCLNSLDSALNMLARVSVEGRYKRASKLAREALYKKAQDPVLDPAGAALAGAVPTTPTPGLSDELSKHLGWGLAGAGIGAGLGGLSQLLAEKKKRRPLSAMLMGGLLGATGGAGASLVHSHFGDIEGNKPKPPEPTLLQNVGESARNLGGVVPDMLGGDTTARVLTGGPAGLLPEELGGNKLTQNTMVGLLAADTTGSLTNFIARHSTNPNNLQRAIRGLTPAQIEGLNLKPGQVENLRQIANSQNALSELDALSRHPSVMTQRARFYGPTNYFGLGGQREPLVGPTTIDADKLRHFAENAHGAGLEQATRTGPMTVTDRANTVIENMANRVAAPGSAAEGAVARDVHNWFKSLPAKQREAFVNRIMSEGPINVEVPNVAIPNQPHHVSLDESLFHRGAPTNRGAGAAFNADNFVNLLRTPTSPAAKEIIAALKAGGMSDTAVAGLISHAGTTAGAAEINAVLRGNASHVNLPNVNRALTSAQLQGLHGYGARSGPGLNIFAGGAEGAEAAAQRMPGWARRGFAGTRIPRYAAYGIPLLGMGALEELRGLRQPSYAETGLHRWLDRLPSGQ